MLRLRISGQTESMEDPAISYMRHVLAARGWNANELAQKAGLSHSTINRPLTIPDWPNAISRRTIEAVRLASGIDPAPFIGSSLPAVESALDSLIPIYNVQASAGHGIEVGEEAIVERLAFPPNYLRRITRSDPKALAIIGIKGQSMAPTLNDDDLVMIDTAKTDLSWGGIFVIRVDGDGLLVKRISMGSARGLFKIVSDNPAFPPVERRAEDVEVIGRVIWYGVKA